MPEPNYSKCRAAQLLLPGIRPHSRVMFIGDSASSNPRLWSSDELHGSWGPGASAPRRPISLLNTWRPVFTGLRAVAKIPEGELLWFLLLELEKHVNLGIYFHWFSFEERWLIGPLTNSVESSLHQ